jgi:phthiocerol/phenolphthiocerol synthesis type-I polyketide synthase E
MSQAEERRWNGSEIAIIGLACRFPGARDAGELWANLRQGVESITFLSDAELEVSSFGAPPRDQPSFVRAASCLEDADLFDAAFFGFTPAEAEVMDPQQRLFLECAWEALEQAGYDPESCPGAVGVFAGSRTNTYIFNLFSNRAALAGLDPFQVGLGNDFAFLASRVSYKLNLRGPSYAVHTACSTGLVAVHLARQSLLIDECQMALAGGVVVNVPQRTGYLYQPGSVFSPDGHTRAFDAAGRGTVFGSGLGVVVLKRLDDALADGDEVWAVIRGSAANNDGARKASFTAPSVQGQAEVILEALADADVEPETIRYVEAHGTGTQLGDPIELRALAKALDPDGVRRGHCAIGSVKTNLGHLDAAAGISSLIKVVLALRHREIPPSLFFEAPTPQFDFAASPFYVSTETRPWDADPFPRRAGLSSFGIGGTNVHVLLEEAPAAAPAGEAPPWHLLVLSARTETALGHASERLVEHLRSHPDLPPADVAYTLAVGRKGFNHRRVCVARNLAEAAAALARCDPERVHDRLREEGERPVVFLLPGQGAQRAGMGAGLYRRYPVYREAFDLCADLLRPELDLRSLVLGGTGEERLQRTDVAQPALFAVEYALAQLFISWGVRPHALLGHSLGEYVAACLAGTLSVEDAVPLVAERGRLMQRQPEGVMLAVSLGEAEVRALLPPEIELAAVNATDLTVVTGPEEALAGLERTLAARGVEHRRLRTSHAFHSALVDPVVEPFAAAVARVALQPPRSPWISNLTGTWISPEQAVDSAYWARHLRQPVRFFEGIGALLESSPSALFLEVGPGASLSRLVRRHPACHREREVVTALPEPGDPDGESRGLLSGLGKLWAAGAEVRWQAVHGRRRRLPLPTYPFERKRYWIEPNPATAPAAAERGKAPDLADWFFLPSWRRSLPPLPAEGDGEPGCWLVFLDGLGLGERLAGRLEERGADIVRVIGAEGFGRGDYVALLESLKTQGKSPSGAAHLLGLTEAVGEVAGPAAFRDAQRRGYYSLLHLCQALLQVFPGQEARIVAVADRLLAVGDGDEIRPERSTLLAPAKAVPQERREITCKVVDVRLPRPGGREEAALVEHLEGELLAPKAGETVIAYRGGRRWVQSFDPVRIGAGTSFCSLRRRGVYLITGGLGGVGLLLAGYLAREHQARLVLSGRTPLPPREQWDAWLESRGEEDPTSVRIRQLRELESFGAEVLVEAADVTDPEQARALIAAAERRFGCLHGVIHGAGVTAGPSLYRPVDEVGEEESETQFAPKVYGLYALEQALAGRELDFRLLMSSNAAVLGGLGYLTYTAANLFLDAFAASRAGGRERWISVDWDPWPKETKRYEGVHTALDRYAMTREESAEAFRRAIASGIDGQLVVATGDFVSRLERWVDGTDQDIAPAHERPQLRNRYTAPRTPLEASLVEVWEEVLGVREIGVEDNFFDLGGHSLLATRLVARIRLKLEVDLPLQRIFETPTVAGLAEAVESPCGSEDDEVREILAQLAALSEEEAAEELSRREP